MFNRLRIEWIESFKMNLMIFLVLFYKYAWWIHIRDIWTGTYLVILFFEKSINFREAKKKNLFHIVGFDIRFIYRLRVLKVKIGPICIFYALIDMKQCVVIQLN